MSSSNDIKARRQHESSKEERIREREESARGRRSVEFHDWQLDSTFDSKNLTTTRDLDNFIATLGGSVPLVNMADQLRPFAKQMEAEIEVYLNGSNRDMQSKCVIAQEILRHGIERSPELIDELYLQLMKHLQGSNRHTSVRGWELLLLAACASRPSAKFLEEVNNFVHATSHTKVQWPTTVSILSKRTWTALKHNSKPGRRVNVPAVGEIASVLSSKSMKVQVSFVDGSNKWLFYDWTTTISSAVEQLAAQIGLKNYEDYTLFEVRKVPKKLDTDGNGSIATLPPDSYLLLDDNRRIADVLQDYEVRGARNKLLLKRKRFDSSEADFSKPQFIALTESHQAVMDEKVAEVANLTLRLREMSGKVMWFEAQQNEKNAEVAAIQEQMEAAEQRIRELEFKGVSIETREVMAERDQLAEKVRSLEAEAARASQQRRSLDMEAVMGGEWKPLALVRKLAMKHEELKRLQAELDILRSMVPPADQEKAATVAFENTARLTTDGSPKSGLKEDVEADISEKEALYDLLRLHSLMEEEHAEEVASKEHEIDHLKQMVEALARRQSKSFSRSNRQSMDKRAPGSAQQDDSRELRRSLDDGSLSNMAGFKEQLEIATAASIALEGKVGSLQEALELEHAAKAELEHQLLGVKRQVQTKEARLQSQEKEWRALLLTTKADAATLQSRLKSREAALAQATADLEDLHKECGQLKVDLDSKEWELDCTSASLASASADRDAAQAALQQLKGTPAAATAPVTSDAGKGSRRKEVEVQQLTQQMVAIMSERDAALEKLAGIQQLMFGLGQGGAHTQLSEHANGSSLRTSVDREGKAKSVNNNCPLEIGRDPRRESIGGASAPTHLKGLPPLRVLPEDKKALGTKHTIFAPSYAPTPEKREGRSARLEAHAMLSAADVRRRLYKKQASSAASGTERPAPQTLTTPRMTERINSGTHLLGLLSNAKITTSHDSFVDGDDGILTSGGARDDIQGLYAPELLKTNSSVTSQDQPGTHRAHDFSANDSSALEGRQILSSGALSTQSESDIRKAYESAFKTSEH